MSWVGGEGYFFYTLHQLFPLNENDNCVTFLSHKLRCCWLPWHLNGQGQRSEVESFVVHMHLCLIERDVNMFQEYLKVRFYTA